MKILVICQFYYPENFTITKIAEELAKRGHDVTVLTGKPNYGYGYILPDYKHIKKEKINNVEVHRVNLFPRKKTRISVIHNYLSFWYNSKRWVRKNKKLKFDIVYSMSISPVTILSAGNLYKKHHPNVKHVVHCVDLWPESVVSTNAVKEKSLTYHFLFKWSKSLYEKVDHILIGSPSFSDYFHNVLGIDKPMDFVPQPALVEGKIDALKLDKNKVNIAYCGNLGIMQNIPELIKAINNVKKENIVFHFIGMGPYSDLLKKYIKDNEFNNKVLYYGTMKASDAAKVVKGCDFALISLLDRQYIGKTIPNKFQFALSLGMPIILSAKGDSFDIMGKIKGGISCDNDFESIALAIRKASKLSEKEKAEMSLNNSTYFDNEYSINKIGTKIEKILFLNVINK